MTKEKLLKDLERDLNEITGHRIPQAEFNNFSVHPYELELTPGKVDEIEEYLKKLRSLTKEYQTLMKKGKNENLNFNEFEKLAKALREEYSTYKKEFEVPRRLSRIKAVEKLVKDHPKNINLRGNNGKTLLIEFAIRRSGPEFLELLLQNGADINAQGDLNSFEFGNTALHWCIANAYVKKALWLITNGPKYGINYNLLGHGQTALHLAIAKGPNHVTGSEIGKVPGGFREIINALIENGADINIKEENNGFTPLHLAVLHRDAEITKLLLDKGADPSATDNHGNTAFDMLKIPYETTEDIIHKRAGVYTLSPKNEWEAKYDDIQIILSQKISSEVEGQTRTTSLSEILELLSEGKSDKLADQSAEEDSYDSSELAPEEELNKLTTELTIEPQPPLPQKLQRLKEHAEQLKAAKKNDLSLQKATAIESFIKEYESKTSPDEKLELVNSKLKNLDNKSPLLINTGTGFYKLRNIFFPRKHFNNIDDKHKHLSNSKTEDILLEIRADLKP